MASTSDAKIDNLFKTMERMMERIILNEREPPRENEANPKNGNRSQNFRRDPPQNRERDNDQQIRPPFQENYVDEEERETKEMEENHVNLIDSYNEDDVFLTEEEQGMFSQTKLKETMRILKSTS